ncbi:hypothetical protein C0J52_09711 [Blattella germanica]|nr:hypothetical protein C0J52_09711 [Blattella germanica]
MTVNFNKICRLCMVETENLLPIFRDGEDFPGRIFSLSSVLKLCEDDELPKNVCHTCENQVNVSYNFKVQCERSDTKLRKLLIEEQGCSRSKKDCHINDLQVKVEEETEISVEVDDIDFDSSDDNDKYELLLFILKC